MTPSLPGMRAPGQVEPAEEVRDQAGHVVEGALQEEVAAFEKVDPASGTSAAKARAPSGTPVA
ncbi:MULTISPECIES: hypothetical protein [unclassified Nonomuraea]|uniref:hypothetical protein n=1 Tax=unclassified Nonomuraea TaxID=2593643 RepID=UPI001377C1FB|nr:MULTISPECIES: hypothetical protein [unclassified Nonomuraea]NBE99880.1 hypothetical protein [Nonomuraea sp. K271]